MGTAVRLLAVAVMLAAFGLGYWTGRRGDGRNQRMSSGDTAAQLEEIARKMDDLIAAQAALQVAIDTSSNRTSPGKTQERASALPLGPQENAQTATLPARSPEALTSEVEAQRIISNAVSTGTWTPADRDRLRQALRSADSAGRHTALRELAVAINSGSLTMKDLRSPFF